MGFKERRKRPRRHLDVKDKAHETDYARRQEMEFRAAARRNKLLAEWTTEQFGLSGDAVESYVKEVIASDLEPGDADVLRKVLKDFADQGVDMNEQTLRQKMDGFWDLAKDQIAEELAAKGD